jgi:uncharacterized membrane protein
LKINRSNQFLYWSIPVLIILGIVFRFIHLDYKVYWHDEVYTVIRATGFTSQSIDANLFRNQIIAPADLLKFQQIKPGSTAIATLQSLVQEDPQHPPLYFLLTRAWMHLFGSSLTAVRSLPAFLSLFSLPLMYALAMELFASRLTAALATTLIALSPLDILFAQTARQAGLVTVFTIASSWLLLRSLRLSKWQTWGLYSLTITLGLYTQPLFGLTIIAHALYVVLCAKRSPSSWGRRQPKFSHPIWFYGTANAIAIILYAPWMRIMFGNLSQAAATTNWTKSPTNITFLLKVWILRFTSLFFDINSEIIPFEELASYFPFLLLIALSYFGFLLLIGFSLYTVCCRNRRSVWLFVILNAFVPFLILVLPDLIIGGRRSIIIRYLVACFPPIQLAVAYGLTVYLTEWKRLGKVILTIVVVSSLVSGAVSFSSNTWWIKDISYFNAAIATRLNALPSVLLITDRGNEFTNLGNLVSIGDRLQPNVKLLPLSFPPDLQSIESTLTQPSFSDLIVYNPSTQLREALLQRKWKLESFFKEGKLEKLNLLR